MAPANVQALGVRTGTDYGFALGEAPIQYEQGTGRERLKPMHAAIQNQSRNPAAKQILTAAPPGLLQAKCACSSAGVSGQCEECNNKRIKLQRSSGDRQSPATLTSQTAHRLGGLFDQGFGHDFGRVKVHNQAQPGIQAKAVVRASGNPYEEEADRIAEQVTRSSAMSASKLGDPSIDLSRAHSDIQRQAVDETQTAPPAAAVAEPEPAPTQETVSPGLILEDDSEEVGPEQMRKSEFLDELEGAVCAAADAELVAAGRTAQGCPYIAGWIAYYRTRSSDHIERAIRRYAPETAGVTSARDYIPIISDHVRAAVSQWVSTGKITGVPEGVQPTPPGAGPSPGGGQEGRAAASTAGNVQLKSRDSGRGEADNPSAIRSKLGSGQGLDSNLRSRMESAFGHDFSRVRVHADNSAAEISTGLNARAFTIGSDIAFASGEYRPGTLIGDALVAHELAHVVQQGGGSADAAPQRSGDGAYDSLEEDADRSAAGAVMSLWSNAKGSLSQIGRRAMPSLRSGLRLSRCCDARWGPFCIWGDAAFTSAVTTDLTTLNGTTQGSGAFAALSSVSISSGVCGFIPDKIYYTPSGCAVPNDCGGSDAWTKAPNHVFLFHEVAHAYVSEIGHAYHAERECMATGLGSYFTSTAFNENQLRCELGLPIRPCYGKECKDHAPPSCPGASTGGAGTSPSSGTTGGTEKK